MPWFLTTYVAHGRRSVGPLIDTPTRDAAEAICDVLAAPDGAMSRLEVVAEALVARPGPKPSSRPRVTCECGHDIVVLLGPAPRNGGQLPFIGEHMRDGKRAPRHGEWGGPDPAPSSSTWTCHVCHGAVDGGIPGIRCPTCDAMTCLGCVASVNAGVADECCDDGFAGIKAYEKWIAANRCPRSGQAVVVDPDLVREIRKLNGWNT